jgi:hypothetical protein
LKRKVGRLFKDGGVGLTSDDDVARKRRVVGLEFGGNSHVKSYVICVQNKEVEIAAIAILSLII